MSASPPSQSLLLLRSMASPYAFVTLVSSDSYLPGALALAAALKDVHPSPPVEPEVDFQTVCLVTPETVQVSTIKLLRKAFNLVIGVEVLEGESDRNLILLGGSLLGSFHSQYAFKETVMNSFCCLELLLRVHCLSLQIYAHLGQLRICVYDAYLHMYQEGPSTDSIAYS